MICFGNKIIDKAFLGEIEITNAFFGESSMLDYLPYILTDRKSVILDAKGTPLMVKIITNINYNIL